MKTVILYRLMICCTVIFFSVIEIKCSPIDDYKNAKKYLLAINQFDLAKEKIKNNEDEAVTAEAIKDIIKYSLSLKKNDEALVEIETLLIKVNEKSELYGRANLAKARLLMRKGNKEEAMALMKRGVHERWKENAFWEINDSLLETGQEDLCAIDEYDRNTTDEYDSDLRSYYGIGSDFSFFFYRLYSMKLSHPEKNAMLEVYPHLKPSKWRPYALPMAKALCLAADMLYVEALKELDTVEKQIKNKTLAENEYDETQGFPLIKTTVLMIEAHDFNAARSAFQEYIQLNKDNIEYPNLIMNRALELLYVVKKDLANSYKMPELTGFILQSELLTDEETRKQFPEHQIASLYDMHQLGLFHQGRSQEAAQWAKKGMELFFPQTLGGANCAVNWANYLSGEGQIQEAKRILLRVLSDAPFDDITPWVRLDLAYIALLENNPFEALSLIQEIQDQVSLEDIVPSVESLRRALKLKEEILDSLFKNSVNSSKSN